MNVRRLRRLVVVYCAIAAALFLGIALYDLAAGKASALLLALLSIGNCAVMLAFAAAGSKIDDVDRLEAGEAFKEEGSPPFS